MSFCMRVLGLFEFQFARIRYPEIDDGFLLTKPSELLRVNFPYVCFSKLR